MILKKLERAPPSKQDLYLRGTTNQQNYNNHETQAY